MNEPNESKYERHASKEWSDGEDTFKVSLETSQSGEGPFVVVSGNAAFLTLEQAQEVVSFLNEQILAGAWLKLFRERVPTWSEVLNYRANQRD